MIQEQGRWKKCASNSGPCFKSVLYCLLVFKEMWFFFTCKYNLVFFAINTRKMVWWRGFFETTSLGNTITPNFPSYAVTVTFCILDGANSFNHRNFGHEQHWSEGGSGRLQTWERQPVFTMEKCVFTGNNKCGSQDYIVAPYFLQLQTLKLLKLKHAFLFFLSV